jgi:pimeloyl-ACP methyl ester carboxylesterase
MSVGRMRKLDYLGGQFAFVDRGSGDPVVFLHNGALGHRLWEHQIEHFARSRRVVAPDLLGHGESDRPERILTADDFVGQIEHLADELALGRFDLVGCCLGGAVALEFARRRPTQVRTLSLVTAVTPKVLASGPFGPFERFTRPGTASREFLRRRLERSPGRQIMSAAMLRWQCGARALADRSFREYVEGLYRSPGEWRIFCNIDYGTFAHLDDFRRPPGFPPTLVLWGNENRIIKAPAGRALARRIGADRAEFWDGCGYMIMRERPEATNRVLEDFFGQAGTDPRARRAWMARAGIEPATPRFSVVCSTN